MFEVKLNSQTLMTVSSNRQGNSVPHSVRIGIRGQIQSRYRLKRVLRQYSIQGQPLLFHRVDGRGCTSAELEGLSVDVYEILSARLRRCLSIHIRRDTEKAVDRDESARLFRRRLQNCKKNQREKQLNTDGTECPVEEAEKRIGGKTNG